MNQIILTRTKQGWVAEYIGPYSERVRELFGSKVLPTAFTSNALPAVVKREVEHLNPDCEVRIA